jgi:hypothetical protein
MLYATYMWTARTTYRENQVTEQGWIEYGHEKLQTTLNLLQLTPSSAKSFEYGEFLRDHEPMLLQLSYLQRRFLVLISPGAMLIVLVYNLIGCSKRLSRSPVELKTGPVKLAVSL